MKEFEHRLDRDIQIVIKTISNVVSNIDAILLCGGYGRGEGAWIQSESTNEVSPYNDYDICVVTDTLLDRQFIKSLENKISNIIGIKWIDIEMKTKKKLTQLKPTIKNVDLKYASKVIFGDTEILRLIPVYNTEDIGLLDVETLYFTRLWAFMGSLDEEGFSSLNETEARFFKYLMAKAVLAVIDVLLINVQKYETSYAGRLISAIKIFPEKEWLNTLGNWALNEKLSPSSNDMTQNEVIELYNEVHKIYKREIGLILSSYYPFGFRSWRSLGINYTVAPYYLLRRLYYILIKRSKLFERDLTIRRIQNYIFFAYDEGSINNMIVNKANRLIQKLVNGGNKVNSWDQLRVMIAQLRNEG